MTVSNNAMEKAEKVEGSVRQNYAQFRNDSFKVKISGLRRKLTPSTYGKEPVTIELDIPSATLITELGERLSQPELGMCRG